MFGVVYLPRFSLQAVLRQDPELRGQPVALIDPASSKPILIQLTNAARARGVVEGLTASQAMARCGELLIRSRSIPPEETATRILLQTAHAFSPNIEATAAGVCTLELKGLGLSTDEDRKRWAGQILQGLAGLNLEAQIGIAATPALAWIAAKAAEPVLLLERQAPARHVSSSSPLQAGLVPGAPTVLESFPLSTLEPPPEIFEILKRWGIHTIGSLLAIGKDRMTERLGPTVAELFDRVSLDAVRPLKLVVPSEVFEEQMDFEHEIETAEPLLFVLRRFVEQLARRLEVIHLVTATLHLRLGLSSGETYQRAFKIPAPTGSIDTLFRMLQTHLETVRTDAPIVSLRLEATPCPPGMHQFGLFETTLKDPNQFAETMARLVALCGPDRVGTPVVTATHRPDVFRMKAPEFDSVTQTGSLPYRELAIRQRLDSSTPRQLPVGDTADCQSALPLRRFRPVIAARVESREERPALIRSSIFNGAIAGVRGPFLSSGDWWDRDSWSREEWDVQAVDGSIYRIFRSPEGWFIEGVYD